MTWSINLFLRSTSSPCFFDTNEKEKKILRVAQFGNYFLFTFFFQLDVRVLKPSFVLKERSPSLYSELPLVFRESTLLVLTTKKGVR